MKLPKIVSRDEWQAAREELLAKEKAHTRAGDALAAEHRRLPMVRIEKEYVFEGPALRLVAPPRPLRQPARAVGRCMSVLLP